MFRFLLLRQSTLPMRLGITVFGIRLFEDTDSVGNTTSLSHAPAQIASETEGETGWDRVKQIFQKDEFDSWSPELESTLSAGLLGFMVGSVIGGLNASKQGYEDFVKKSKAATFTSQNEARDELRRKVSKVVRAQAFKVGWRLGLFTGSFVFFTTAVSTYRNKTSVMEYAAGGLLSGAIYRIPMGPKAMFSTGIVGCGLGTIAGCVSVSIMKLTGTTTEDLRLWRKGWKEDSVREFSSLTNQSRTAALGKIGVMHEIELMDRLKEEAAKKNEKVETLKQVPKENEQVEASGKAPKENEKDGVQK